MPQVCPRVSSHKGSCLLKHVQEYFPTELQASIVTPVRAILDQLRIHGATIVPLSLPSTPYALSAYYVISSAEASSNLARYDGIEYGKSGIPTAYVSALNESVRNARRATTRC